MSDQRVTVVMILPRTVDIVDIADIVTDFTLLPLIRASPGWPGC